MILPRVKQRRSRQLAWALLVVIGKYQVVQDLKDSNEGEKKCHAFFVCIDTQHLLARQQSIVITKPDGAGWDITRQILYEKKLRLLADY